MRMRTKTKAAADGQRPVGFAIAMPDGTRVVFVSGEFTRIVLPGAQPGVWNGGAVAASSRRQHAAAG